MPRSTDSNEGLQRNPLIMTAWIGGALMLAGAIGAKQFIGEPEWISSLAQMGALLLGIGITSELVSRTSPKKAYGRGLGLAIIATLLLTWVNGAVGILGASGNRVNLMYGGVALVGVVGAIMARFRPIGMAWAMFATAAALVLAGLIALVGGLGSTHTGALELLSIHGAFAALFIGAALLFRKIGSAV